MLNYIRDQSIRLAVEVRSLTTRNEGQALIEYALIVSLIAIVAIGALSLTGTNLKTVLNKIAGDV